jgi:hypothetical protein
VTPDNSATEARNVGVGSGENCRTQAKIAGQALPYPPEFAGTDAGPGNDIACVPRHTLTALLHLTEEDSEAVVDGNCIGPGVKLRSGP